jgi:hydrogenase maturation protein HypF
MLGEIHGSKFTQVVCDRHPDYASTRYARASGLPCVAVQHHLAHILACLLEHRRGPTASSASRGTAPATARTARSGAGNSSSCRSGKPLGASRACARSGCPGESPRSGTRARTALALAHAAADPGLWSLGRRLGFSDAEAGLLGHHAHPAHQLARDDERRAPLRRGRGAARRRHATTRSRARSRSRSRRPRQARRGTRPRCPSPCARSPPGAAPTWSSTGRRSSQRSTRAADAGRDPRELAASFHRALADGIVATARAAGVGTVALGGGCFQNALLTDLASASLEAAGFEVLVPRELPPNDGAIAAGQALGALLNLKTVFLG